ncbi:MAG: CvpA family protein [Kiloniellales bacterium]|nr:CvpA family protein [Kiloniellales bacterium]
MDSLPINVTDLGILVVLLLSGALAFMRGLVHSLLSVGAWIGAIVATVAGLPLALPFARDMISIQIVADIAAGVAIFIVVLILCSIVTHWCARRVRESSLGALDRSLGLLFGLLRGAVFVCLAWIALLLVLPRAEHPPWIQEARALPLVDRGKDMILDLVPENVFPALQALRGGGAGGAPEATFENLIKPGVGEVSGASANGAGPADGTGYKDAERKDMRRAIESAQ